ncbi:hypothetical protein pb186bvf_011662 [Paramecium bursaria]
MNANQMTAELIAKLQSLMKNQERLRALVEQNTKDKIALGLVRKIGPQNQAEPALEQQIQQDQEIVQTKQKSELKHLNNDQINQLRTKSRIREKLKKNALKEIQETQEFCQSDIQNQEVQKLPQKERNTNEVNLPQDLQNSKPEAIQNVLLEDNKQKISKGIQKQKIKKDKTTKKAQNKSYYNILIQIGISCKRMIDFFILYQKIFPYFFLIIISYIIITEIIYIQNIKQKTLGDIILNLTYPLHQQSLLFLQQVEEQSRELRDLVITNFTLIPPDSDIEQSHSQDEIQVKVEAQEQKLTSNNSKYNQTEQEKTQLKFQLYSFKKLRKEYNIIFDTPEQFDGVYLLKDKLRTLRYIPNQVLLQKKVIKKKKPKSIKKQVRFEKNLLQQEDIQQKGQSEVVDVSPQKLNTIVKNQEIQELLLSEDEQNQQQTGENKKLKTEQQLSNQPGKIRQKRYYPKLVKNYICSHCDKQYIRLDGLLQHQAKVHGIIRKNEELLYNKFQNQQNQNKVQGQLEQLQLLGHMEKSQFHNQ